jgi:adenylate cyclase
LKQLFYRYAYAGCLPEDTPQIRLQKAIMVIAPTLISFFCIFWVAGYYLLGKPVSAAIPGGYAVFSTASILLFFKTKHYGFFRFSQIFLILCLPFLLQISLGGFRAGSAVFMWGTLAPIAAMMFQGTRAAAYWFGIFVILTIIGGLAEGYLASHITPLPEAAITAFFTLNFICAFFMIYICVHYYVSENKRILSIVREQADKLMELDKIKNHFFANLSHEFRTPLALTIGPLEDAIRGEFGEPGERLRKQLEMMLRNSQRLLRLINQLLDISKIESGEMSLKSSNYDIGKMARELCQSFTPFAERKNIEFSFETGDNPLYLEIDCEKIEKVINNLLSNAIKFTPEGGKVKLLLETEETRQGVRLTIWDTGPGISENNIDKIFNRFYQVDGSSTRDYEGTGIGLSLVKELVELHGGNIEVKSEHGFGSEFIVFIPGQVSHAQIGNKSSWTINKGDSQELTNIKVVEKHSLANTSLSDESKNATVLIVDDNSDIRDYLATCLMPEFNVVQAADGEEGIALAHKHQPDLVISDIMMPGVDGYQLCSAIKEDAQLSHTPVIFLTARASEEMKLEGLETGADDYLAKPFSARELLARSRNLITLHNQKKELKKLNLQLEQQVKDQLDELVKNRRLTSYFSGNLLRRILNEEETAELVTERRNITVFFSDLCNFTDMTDRMESEQATILLNDYLSVSVALVEQHGATVIQIIGDAIMAFFGAPEEMDKKQQAQKAVQLGVAMQKKVKELSQNWLAQGLEYEGLSRIGIHQDYVTVGNFGSHNLMEYTAVGRGVNLAARLEASCTPGRIKVSQPVHSLTSELFDYEPLREEQFKGFARQLKVAELDPVKQVN